MEEISLYEETLAKVTHDLKSPLVNTRNTASIIRHELSNAEPDFQKIDSMLLDIELHMKTCMHLIDALSYRGESANPQFSPKIKRGHILIDVIKQVEHLCRRMAKKIQCDTDLMYNRELKNAILIMDTAALEICLTNLGLNAAKYSISGSVIKFEIRDLERVIVVRIGNFTSNEHAELFGEWQKLGFSSGGASSGIGLHLVKTICDQTGMLFYQKTSKNARGTWVTSELNIPKGDV